MSGNALPKIAHPLGHANFQPRKPSTLAARPLSGVFKTDSFAPGRDYA